MARTRWKSSWSARTCRSGTGSACGWTSGEEVGQPLGLLVDGGAFGTGEDAQRGDSDGVVRDGPGGGDAAVDEHDAGAGDGDQAVGVVDDAGAVVVAEQGVVEGGQK